MYRPSPTRIGHLVLRVRDIKKSVDFYRDVVGLEVSDWIGEQMVFMRAGTDHHDLGLVQLPNGGVDRPKGDYPSVEHFSYRVESIDEIMRITQMLQERGIKIDRGPGRHGPGDNTFIVFQDPDDNNVEFYSDMTIVDDEHPYEARVWDGQKLETFDQWRLEKFVVEPPARIKKILGD